jgi:phasin family protein
MATTKKPASSEPRNPLELPSLEQLKAMASQFKLPGVDVNAIVEWQRKDLEALAEANRRAYEGMQALTQRRAEMLRDAFAQLQSMAKDGAGKDLLAKQSEAVQQGMKQALDNARELAQMEAKTRSDAWQVMQERLTQNMTDLQSLLTPKK